MLPTPRLARALLPPGPALLPAEPSRAHMLALPAWRAQLCHGHWQGCKDSALLPGCDTGSSTQGALAGTRKSLRPF